jgi:hypothetical protein
MGWAPRITSRTVPPNSHAFVAAGETSRTDEPMTRCDFIGSLRPIACNGNIRRRHPAHRTWARCDESHRWLAGSLASARSDALAEARIGGCAVGVRLARLQARLTRRAAGAVCTPVHVAEAEALQTAAAIGVGGAGDSLGSGRRGATCAPEADRNDQDCDPTGMGASHFCNLSSFNTKPPSGPQGSSGRGDREADTQTPTADTTR